MNGNIALELEKFIPIDKITLDFYNLCYNPKKNDTKPILNNVSGSFVSKRLTAIIGPSGAGKTSLLNILSGYRRTNVSGDILLNGNKVCGIEIRKRSSYIAQEFHMLDFLTLSETINFAADFLMGSKIKKDDKVKSIEDILELLGLTKCKNSYVCKLSGGEKKRLTIALNLLSDPPMMFLDEPTSGLDSVSSNQVLNYLSELCEQGKLIVVVIHQPSSRHIQLFSDILLLSGGNLLYNGPYDQMLTTFDGVGLKCPNYYNPADFALEIASKEHGEDCANVMKKKFLKKKNSNDASSVLNPSEKKCLMSKTLQLACDNAKLRKGNWFSHLLILMRRNTTAMWRDFMAVQLRVVCHIFVAFLLGAVYYDIGTDLSKIMSNGSCLFFFILFLFFANAMPSVISCPMETKVFLREYLSGWYSVTSYFLSKLTCDFQLQILCPTLFVGIAYYLSGQPLEIDRISKVWLISILTTILGNTIGLLAGSACDIKLGAFVVPASSIPMLIFSGFFVRKKELSVYLQPLIHLSYFRYSFDGYITAIYGNNRTDLKCSDVICYFKDAKSYLKFMNISEDDNYSFDVLMLVIWILAFQLILFISLLCKVKYSQ